MKITISAKEKCMTLDEVRHFVDECERNNLPGESLVTISPNFFPAGSFKKISAEAPKESTR